MTIEIIRRLVDELGSHPGLQPRALSKQEVVAALCRAGHLAGFWAIPEFEILDPDCTRRRIDVVWARRVHGDKSSLWIPCAAYEVEGLDVAKESVIKNAHSLAAATAAGASICAMVLFQVGPRGECWSDMKGENGASRAKGLMQDAIARFGYSTQVEVVVDEGLCWSLEAWMHAVLGDDRIS